jgi:DNA polymerase/3'-5' exonuclease PolX
VEKFRAENSHWINNQQENKTVIFWAGSREKAREKFVSMRKKDTTIQEAGLFRVKDNSLVDEYIGYI